MGWNNEQVVKGLVLVVALQTGVNAAQIVPYLYTVVPYRVFVTILFIAAFIAIATTAVYCWNVRSYISPAKAKANAKQARAKAKAGRVKAHDTRSSTRSGDAISPGFVETTRILGIRGNQIM